MPVNAVRAVLNERASGICVEYVVTLKIVNALGTNEVKGTDAENACEEEKIRGTERRVDFLREPGETCFVRASETNIAGMDSQFHRKVGASQTTKSYDCSFWL